MTDQELQSLRNLGNEAEAAVDEIERLRAALETIAAQHSGEVCSTKRSDCMASIAAAALRPNV